MKTCGRILNTQAQQECSCCWRPVFTTSHSNDLLDNVILVLAPICQREAVARGRLQKGKASVLGQFAAGALEVSAGCDAGVAEDHFSVMVRFKGSGVSQPPGESSHTRSRIVQIRQILERNKCHDLQGKYLNS